MTADRTRSALRIYRRLWIDKQDRKLPLNRVEVLRARLNGLLCSMTQRETSEYYAGIRKIRGES